MIYCVLSLKYMNVSEYIIMGYHLVSTLSEKTNCNGQNSDRLWFVVLALAKAKARQNMFYEAEWTVLGQSGAENGTRIVLFHCPNHWNTL